MKAGLVFSITLLNENTDSGATDLSRYQRHTRSPKLAGFHISHPNNCPISWTWSASHNTSHEIYVNDPQKLFHESFAPSLSMKTIIPPNVDIAWLQGRIQQS